jgi:hypothetical protein
LVKNKKVTFLDVFYGLCFGGKEESGKEGKGVIYVCQGKRKGCGTVKVDKQCFMVMPFCLLKLQENDNFK